MASTFSNLKFELIGSGEQSGIWGSTTNTNIGTAVEQAIVGMATLSSSDFTANVATLTLSNTNALQNARALCLNIAAGAVSAAGTVNVPAIQKNYIVINNSSYTVTVKVSGLTGVAVPAGKRTVIYNNGTDIGDQVNYLSSLTLGTPLPFSSGGTGATTSTGTGALVFADSPTITSPTLITPILGTPISGNFGSGTFTWPTFNQNTTGTAANVTGVVAVVNGGTGLTAGTSGGVLYYSATGTLASSAVLAASALVVGGGAGVAPATVTTGTGVLTALAASTNAAAGVVTGTGTGTLQNKRIDPRVVSTTTATTLTPDVSAADQYAYTALASGLTINAPTGTPVDGDKLIFRILDNGTPRALTWNATYTVIGTILPTTTTASKMTYVGCIYNAANTRWDVVAATTQV